MRDVDIMADRILRACEDKHISVRTAAMRCGIPETTMYQVTGRKGELSCRNLRKLCRSMHVSADWLLGLDGGAK